MTRADVTAVRGSFRGCGPGLAVTCRDCGYVVAEPCLYLICPGRRAPYNRGRPVDVVRCLQPRGHDGSHWPHCLKCTPAGPVSP